MRGPGLAKYELASTANTLPCLTAGRSFQPGRSTSFLDCSSAFSMLNPQGDTMITSGWYSSTLSQGIRTESVPFLELQSSPPAQSSICGIQWPPQYRGSTHSRKAALVLRSYLADLVAMFLTFSLAAIIHSLAAWRRPVLRPSS